MAEIIDIGAVGGYSQLAGYGIMDAAGTNVPANDALGYGHGCIFRKANGTTGADASYVNIGDKSSANFVIFNPSYVPTVGLRSYPLSLVDMRVWNAMQTNLGTAAADDLGVSTGSLFPSLTGHAELVTIDFVGATTTAYGRCQTPVPANYIAGQPITVVIKAYLSDLAQVSGQVDLELVRVAAPNTDICATAAQTLSTGVVEYTFTITPTNVVAGELLDLRVALIGDDTGGTGAMLAKIRNLTLNFTTLQ